MWVAAAYNRAKLMDDRATDITPETDVTAPAAPAPSDGGSGGEHLSLTDFMDLPTLQEIQDSLGAVANVKATTPDADGRGLPQPVPTREFVRRQRAIEQAESGPQRAGREYVAPISVNNIRLGTIRMTPSDVSGGTTNLGVDEVKLSALA